MAKRRFPKYRVAGALIILVLALVGFAFRMV
jgi:hypothetical protein